MVGLQPIDDQVVDDPASLVRQERVLRLTLRQPAKVVRQRRLQQLGSAVEAKELSPAEKGPDTQFYIWFAISAAVLAAWTARSYLRMNGERFEVLKLLTSSVMPLGILTVVVLAVILFGITTAT